MSAPEMEQNGLDIDHWDAPIYRVLPLRRFKELIANKKVVLVRPSLWGDPFENFFLKCPVRIPPTGQLGSMRLIADKWYALCWTRISDSDAMWRIYSPKKGGVRISTTIRKLFSAIYRPDDKLATLKYFIGTVQYKSRRQIEDFLRSTTFMDLAFGGQGHNFARTLCTKRLEFCHEQEVRLLFHDATQKKRSDKLRLPFDYSTVLDDVALDPRLDGPGFDACKNELIALGCSLPIIQSELYKIDKIVIDVQ